MDKSSGTTAPRLAILLQRTAIEEFVFLAKKNLMLCEDDDCVPLPAAAAALSASSS